MLFLLKVETEFPGFNPW